MKNQYQDPGFGLVAVILGILGDDVGDGALTDEELHWYKAHGIGRKKMKIKRLLD